VSGCVFLNIHADNLMAYRNQTSHIMVHVVIHQDILQNFLFHSVLHLDFPFNGIPKEKLARSWSSGLFASHLRHRA
jgi:hypothetical protein